MNLARPALLLVLASSLAACGSPAIGDGNDDGDGTEVDSGPVGGFADAAPDLDRDGDEVVDADDNCPELANPDQADGDEDTFGDACDCDPASADVAAYLVVEDALDADRSLLAPAPGFPTSSWSYAAAAYQQTRLVSADDVSLLAGESLTDVLVTATVASTEITTPYDTRQITLLARAEAKDDNLDAVACGIEVVADLTPTQKTSVLRLSGAPAAVALEVLDRVDRGGVAVDELLEIEMELRAGTMTCTARQADGTTVATASAVPVRAGAVGFHTRETRALFKSLRVCAFPPSETP